MMQSEWLEFIGKNDITPEQWENVNLVYTWHPAVPEARDAARGYCRDLFDRFGYSMFEVMTVDAWKAIELDSARSRLLEKQKEEERDFRDIIRLTTLGHGDAQAVFRKQIQQADEAIAALKRRFT